MSTAASALDALLSQLSLAAGGRVEIAGADPAVASPHRIGQAAAVALMAQAVGVDAIWRERGGAAQDIRIDLDDAVHALHPGDVLRQNGYWNESSRLVHEPCSGFFATADDRHVFLNGPRPGLRNGLLRMLDCPNDPQRIAAAVKRRTAIDIEEACARDGLAGVMVRTPAEWAAHPNGRWLAARPVIDIARIGDAPAQPLGAGSRPLAGVRVLDVSHILAGPGLGRTLAEQGADVLRVSSPLAPDIPCLVMETGFGKRTAFLDLDRPADVARLEALAGEADIFVQSFRPGSLARRGFSPERLCALRPGLIYVSVSCYGSGDAPWRDRVGFDPNAQSATGVAVSEGGTATPRLVPTGLLNDYLTAYLGAAGALAALLMRLREGGSYHVNVALARTAMWVQAMGPVERAPVRAMRPPALRSMESAYGILTYLAPPVQYSATPAAWHTPPVPPGAGPAAWLAR